jgi:hypothetical protein
MDTFLVPTSTPLKRSATEVPGNLHALSHEELIELVTSLAAERDNLSRKKSRVDVDSSKRSSMIQTTLAPQNVPSVDISAIKKRLCAKSIKAIKKTKHNDNRKPYTEVTEGLPSKESAMQLLKGFPMKSDTARMTRWVLNPSEIVSFIGCESIIHPVAYDGKVRDV